MTNFEKYKDNILRYGSMVGISKDTNDLCSCDEMECHDCKFFEGHCYDCIGNFFKWLTEEAKTED